MRDSSSGRRTCIAKGYSTIAWTPFFLKITMRCTWPLGALIVCSTSCNTERTQSYFFFLQMSRYWKDADSIVAFHGICSDKVIYHSSPYHTWISISKGLDREKKEEELEGMGYVTINYISISHCVYIYIYIEHNKVIEFAKNLQFVNK